MYYSGVAGLLWIKDIKRENKARKKFFDCLVQKIKDNGLEQLAVSNAPLPRRLRKKAAIFWKRTTPLPNIWATRSAPADAAAPAGGPPQPGKREKFYAQLQKTGIVHPFWYFAAGVVLLVLVYGFMRDPAGILPVWRFLHGM